MASDLVVGVDLGTTALKGALFDDVGNLVASASCDYPIQRPHTDWAEQDPEEWLHALRHVLAELQRAVPGRRAKAIGVCSQVNTHVFVDKRYTALRPAIVWQDQRCAPLAAELNERLGASATTERFGFPSFAPSATPPRAEWVAREEPHVWERTCHVLSPKDFVAARLSLPTKPSTDPITPFDVVGDDGQYDESLVGVVDGLAERLPRIQPLEAIVGCVIGDRFPLIEDAIVVTGTMDAWGAVYGSALLEHGEAMEVAGTSEIVGVMSRESKTTAGVVSFLPVDGLHLHAGPTQAGGAALAWFAALAKLSVPEAGALAADAPAGSDGLVFLPHLLGERAPLWDSEVRGAFIGLSSHHGLAHLCRAVLEGVAYSARHLLETLVQAGEVHPQAIRASGGGSASDLWCQIKADVFGVPLDRLAVQSSGCLGAALMASTGAGLSPSLREASKAQVRVERRFDPNPERELYDELYVVYRDLYYALAPAHRTLASLRNQPQLVVN
jgi:xylulokinase